MSLPPVSMCLNAGAMGRQDAESETLIPTFGGGFDDVAHTLRADGFDASEDGTGRGTPLVPVAVDLRNGTESEVAMTLQAAGMGEARGLTPNALPHVLAFAQNQRDEVRQMDVAGALAAEPGAKQQTYIAFSCKDHGADAGELAPTLRAMGHGASHPNAGGQVAVAFMADDYKEGTFAEADTARPLTTSADRTRAAPIADHAMAVRRLTPVECERLQGATDNWTLVPNSRGKPMADGPRYKMLGNSFAVPVIYWLGQQLQQAHYYTMREAA